MDTGIEGQNSIPIYPKTAKSEERSPRQLIFSGQQLLLMKLPQQSAGRSAALDLCANINIEYCLNRELRSHSVLR